MLSGQIIDDFTRDGAVVLRGVLKPFEVQLLAQGIKHNLAHLSPLAIVAKIAVACGFQSPPHYSKCYRNLFGHTPSAQRQATRLNTMSEGANAR